MKQKIFLTLSLIALMVITFSACTTNNQEAEITNPMEKKESLAAIEEQLGFTFTSLPDVADDLTYFTIAQTTAQASFIDDSLEYTTRKGPITDVDISGVYTNFANGQTIMDERDNVVFYQYNDNKEGLATWQTDNHSYSLLCLEDFDLQTMKKLVNAIS